MRSKLNLFLTLSPFLLIGYLFALVIDAPRTDYFAHIQFAKDLLNNHWPHGSHFIYQIVLILMSKLFNVPIDISEARIITTLMVFLSGLIIYSGLFEKERQKNSQEKIINICIVSGILISMPVPLLFLVDKSLYFGYVGINVLHNPTVIMLKPIALLIFILFCNNIIAKTNKHLLLMSTLVIISALIKPNFILCFIPVALIYYVLKKDKNKQLIFNTLSIVLPGFFILVCQFLLTYVGPSKIGSLEFSPFLVYKIYSSLWTAPFKLLLSIAFPLSVIIFYWEDIKSNVMIQVSVLSLIVSLLFFYLMAENPVPNSGNFWWGSQVALYILFATTAGYFTTKILNPELTNNGLKILAQKNVAVPLLLFLAHVLSGVFYYYDTFSGGIHW